MKIEINLLLLKDVNLTPDDYTYLYIIYKKAFLYLKTTPLRVSPRLDVDEWIIYKEDSTKHVKVDSPTRGIRVLHAKDPKAASNKKARNKYKKIITNKPHLHKYIMKCLQLQLEHEKDNLGYLQNFETWINNHTWEKYEDMNINDIKDDRRNTRKL